MLLIGKLDRLVNILQESEIKNPTHGEITEEWTLYKQLPCSIATGAFGEKVTGVELVNEEKLFLQVRYRDDLNTQMRALIDNITYEILAVTPIISIGRKQGLMIACVAYEPNRGE